jgi:hypothetical protein
MSFDTKDSGDLLDKHRRGELTAFETKDSGDRVEYDSGMQRDTNGGKPRFDLMIPKGVPFEDLYLTRIARLYQRGAVKYEPRNWEKADSQEELDRAYESAFRHFMQWYAGEGDEDHAAAVFFNINEAETIHTKMKTTELMAEWRDNLRRGAVIKTD